MIFYLVAINISYLDISGSLGTTGYILCRCHIWSIQLLGHIHMMSHSGISCHNLLQKTRDSNVEMDTSQ